MEVRSGRTLQPGVALGPVYVQLPRRTGEEASAFQGESVPGICHALAITAP